MSGYVDPWCLAIGASGSAGLIDIRDLLRYLPADLDAVVLVVLHRAWDRTSHLRQVLDAVSAMPVVVAIDGQSLERGTVYIGQPSEHLILTGPHVGGLVRDPQNEHRNRTVDLLLNSVAANARERGICIILSGSLDDGSRGVAAIHKAGGKTMVVRTSSLSDNGMPLHAIGYDGPIDVIGDASEIAAAVSAIIRDEV